ncbi:MAG: DUF4337 family protein, partial [Verrucomicrobia bacterium]|nr:DUF4337 family protein [Verrucomicrobiota bacterium]
DILRDAKADQHAAANAAHKHHWFEYGEICLHIAVVLCSLVLLTNQKLFLHVGLAATIVGLIIAVFAYLVEHHAEEREADAKPAAVAPAKH